MEELPRTIQVPASVQDVVEWLEYADRETLSVDIDNESYLAYLVWIEEGPMGLRKYSYRPGPDPVTIVFEGYVATIPSLPGPDGIRVVWPVDGSRLPVLGQKPEELDWIRELEGLLIIRVEPRDEREATLTVELRNDPEPMFTELARIILLEMRDYFEEKSVLAAREAFKRRRSALDGAAGSSSTTSATSAFELQEEREKAADLVSKKRSLEQLISQLEQQGQVRRARGKTKPEPTAKRAIKDLLRGLDTLDQIELPKTQGFTYEDIGELTGHATVTVQRKVRKLKDLGRLR